MHHRTRRGRATRFASGLALGVAALLGALLPATSSLAANPLPFQVEEVRLKNGLRLLMVPYDAPGIVAYYSLVRVGSRDEVEKGVTGFAHFFEHMMFRGTDRHPPEAVQALLVKAGADQNGFTTDDFTCYTFLGSAAVLEAWIEYEADRFQNLKYTEDVFKTEAGAVLGEYNKSTSQIWLPLQEKLRSSVFSRHTYGHTTMGFVEDIKDMPNQYEYSKKFFERFYTPDNVVLIAVGDIDKAQVKSLVEKHYGGWKRKRAPTKTATEPPQKREVREHVDWPAPTLPHLSMSWRTPATRYGSVDTAVYNVLFEILFGEVSALYRELVLEQQLVAAFEDMNWDHRDPYLFQVVASLKNAEQISAVENRIDKAIQELAAGKIDPAKLDAVKSRVRNGLLLRLQTPADIATVLAFSIAPTGEVDGLARLLKSIDALKPNDVKAFAKKHLTKTNRAVVTLKTKAAPEEAKQ